MNRLVIALSVLLVASILTAGILAKQLFEQRAVHVAEKQQMVGSILALQDARKRDQATLALLRRKNAATAREMASAGASLERALAAEPAWADQPVPEEVRRVLE